jgi:hypothetical protein
MQVRSQYAGYAGGYMTAEAEGEDVALDDLTPTPVRYTSTYDDAPASASYASERAYRVAESGYAPAASPPSGYAPVHSAPPVALDARLHQPEWLVHLEGSTAVVGPVSASQIARGIRAGRVPAEASVQRAGEVFWSGVLDEADIIAALKSL